MINAKVVSSTCVLNAVIKMLY